MMEEEEAFERHADTTRTGKPEEIAPSSKGKEFTAGHLEEEHVFEKDDQRNWIR